MARKKAGAKGDEATAETQWGVLRHVSIAAIEISDRPNREKIDEKAEEFRELVASIKASDGVLQPILLRPAKGREAKLDRFELVAGERRLRAAKAAGRSTIASTMRQMTDAQAAAFQLTENVHRKDLKPLEEAAQVRSMLEAGFVTAEIAKLLGRTPRFVQRRASLTGLSGKWLNAASARDCDFGLWPAAALEKIARLPEDLQDRLFKDWSQSWRGRELKTPAPDPKDLDKAIGDVTRELKRARWKLDDATLAPKAGACSECQKRAGQQPLLWDALEDLDLADPKAQKHDVCLDPGCWAEKCRAFVKAKAAELKEKHEADPVLVRNEHESRERYPTAVSHYEVTRCKQTDKGARPALVVDGPSAGSVTWVKKQSSFNSGGASTRRTGPTPLKARREKLKKRRQALVVGWVSKALADADLENVKVEPAARRSLLVSLAVSFGLGGDHTSGKQAWLYVDDLMAGKADEDGLDGELWEDLQCILDGLLAFGTSTSVPDEPPIVHAEHIAQIVAEDFAELTRRAEHELPDPRSWANLKEDGTPKTATKPARKKSAAKAAKKTKQKEAKRATFRPATGNVHVNQFDVITHGFERIEIPIRKTARGSLAIEVAKYIDRGKDAWYAATVAEFHPGSSHSPISITGTPYKTREAGILAILEDFATTARCGEPGSNAAVKRGKMMQEDIKAFLEAANRDPTYLHPLEPNKAGPDSLACRGCGCTYITPCQTADGPCSWVVAPGTPEAKKKGPLCSACSPADGKPRKRKAK